MSGSAITYGVQNMGGGYDAILKALHSVEYPVCPIDEEFRVTVGSYGSLHQDCFFKMLGFTTVHSLDGFPLENPTFVHDLNEPIPLEMHQQYQLVCDGGTMEHVFDIKTVLTNTVRLLALGGYVLHITPISGWINHGFYQFSPTLFLDFYSENGFELMEMNILLGKDPGWVGESVMEYRDAHSMKDFLGQWGLIFFVARKVAHMETIVNPTQNAYKTQSNPERLRFYHSNLQEPVMGGLTLFDEQKIQEDIANMTEAYFYQLKHSKPVSLI
ncbi:MAG: hypothetical protein K2X66_10865 [Cyanobacteria bacterium]|nr:hypothetical protein [Cyanobacteriota bacterium]